MANESIGNAYLTVKAKPDDDFESTLNKAGSKGGKGFGSAFQVAAGNLMTQAVNQLAQFATDTFVDAFNNYADFEQLKGGVETLFGEEQSAAVMENAKNAFKTAGISANEYMEQATSFSASLIQSLGEDSDQAAAYADMAITDMADNANKMGTDLASIQNAYQGFAKQNFTMLDNLKLGYGGTKEEMERLLRRAEEIEGFEFGSLDVDNFADVAQAIHIVQENMHITGATLAEGTTTISGSLKKLGAAWDNFTTGLFDENADLDQLADDLIDALGTAANNVLGVIGTLFSHVGSWIIDSIGQGLGDAASQLGETFGMIFENIGVMFDTWLSDTSAAIEGVWNGIAGFFAGIWATITTTVSGAVDAVFTTVSGVFEAVSTTVSGIWDGIRSAIETPINAARDAVGAAIDAIKGFFGFEFSWPHLPLPHFAISPEGWQIGDLLKGSIPHLDIQWYGQGGWVDEPTLAGYGERGGEFVWPSYSPYLDKYADALTKAMGGGQTVNIYIDGSAVMTDARLFDAFSGFMRELARKADM